MAHLTQRCSELANAHYRTGGSAPYTFAITSGSLPAGLTLSSSGALSGTPTAGGSFPFTVTATDVFSDTGMQAYTLTVGAPTISVAPTTLTAASVGSAYNRMVTAGSGTAPYTFAITAGSLPAGLSLSSSGTLSGTPTAHGTFTSPSRRPTAAAAPERPTRAAAATR